MNDYPNITCVMNSARQAISDQPTGGFDTRDIIHEIRDFALAHYFEWDLDKDGFVSKAELESAFNDKCSSSQVRAFIKFLLLQIVRGKYAHQSQVPTNNLYISLADIEAYFSQFE